MAEMRTRKIAAMQLQTFKNGLPPSTTLCQIWIWMRWDPKLFT
jgi:hypothetical protein